MAAAAIAHVQGATRMAATAAAYLRVAELGGDCRRAAPLQHAMQGVGVGLPAVDFGYDVTGDMLAASALGLGLLGLLVNIGLFCTLLHAEPARLDKTESEQHWCKTVATFFSCALNLLLAGCGVGLAAAMGPRAAGSRCLVAPLVWAVMQSFSCLVAAAFDGFKNHREGLDLLD